MPDILICDIKSHRDGSSIIQFPSIFLLGIWIPIKESRIKTRISLITVCNNFLKVCWLLQINYYKLYHRRACSQVHISVCYWRIVWASDRVKIVCFRTVSPEFRQIHPLAVFMIIQYFVIISEELDSHYWLGNSRLWRI